MTEPSSDIGSGANEYPDQAGYPDGTGVLNEGTRQLVAEVAADSDAVDVTRDTPGEISADDLEFVNDSKHLRYQAFLGLEPVASMTYNLADDRVILIHTAVKTAYQHRGFASALIRHVLDELRAEGKKATVICPVVREFVDGNHDYDDVVDSTVPGLRSRR